MSTPQRLQPNENRPDLKDLPENRLNRLRSLAKARHKARLLLEILEHGTERQKAMIALKMVEALPDDAACGKIGGGPNNPA